MGLRIRFIWFLVLATALFVVGCSADATTNMAADAPADSGAQAVIPTVTETLQPEGMAAAPSQVTMAVATATAAPAAAEEQPAAAGLRFDVVSGQSEARYRVREQLASLTLPNDAVGATKQVSGSVTILPDGSIGEGSQFIVDMVSIQSDSGRRDGYVRRNVLQTDQYPQAVFVPKTISGLDFPLPAAGEVQFELTGDLTIRDVTREVTWQVSGTIDGPQAVGLATVRFTFADFNLTKPNVASVLSIEDEIDLEIDIVVTSDSGS